MHVIKTLLCFLRSLLYRLVVDPVGFVNLSRSSSSQPLHDVPDSDTDILFLNPVGVIGGAEQVLIQLLRGQCEVRPPERIGLLIPEEGPLLEAAESLGIRRRVVPWSGRIHRLGDTDNGGGRTTQLKRLAAMAATAPGVFASATSWRTAVAEFAPGVLYSNGLKTHLLSSLVRPPDARVVWHLHDFYSQRRVAKRLLRQAARTADLGIAISNAVAADARAVMPQLPIEIVHNGVATDRFKPAGGPTVDLDRLAGLPPVDGAVRVGLIATYGIWKGHDVFLDAAARVVGRSTDQSLSPLTRPTSPLSRCDGGGEGRLESDARVRFYIVGGPIYGTAAQWSRRELERRVEHLSLQKHVGFIDFQADTARIYQSLDIVVHASTRPEPFGLTIAEAMACGKPVVFSNAGGAPEIAEHGRSGLGTQPGDAEALAEAVVGLVENADLRVQLGTVARQRICQQFCGASFQHRMNSVIERVLHDGRMGRLKSDST